MIGSLCCRNVKSVRVNYVLTGKVLYKKPFANHIYYKLDAGLINLSLRKTDYYETYDEADDARRRILKARDAPGQHCVCDSRGNCCAMIDQTTQLM